MAWAQLYFNELIRGNLKMDLEAGVTALKHGGIVFGDQLIRALEAKLKEVPTHLPQDIAEHLVPRHGRQIVQTKVHPSDGWKDPHQDRVHSQALGRLPGMPDEFV